MKKHTIKEAAARLNISSYTLRYYEKLGMVKIKRKEAGGIREYTEDDIKWLEYIVALKKIGFSLEEIKAYTMLKKQDTETLSKRRKLLDGHLTKIKEQIDFLNDIKISVEDKIACIDNREEK